MVWIKDSSKVWMVQTQEILFKIHAVGKTSIAFHKRSSHSHKSKDLSWKAKTTSTLEFWFSVMVTQSTRLSSAGQGRWDLLPIFWPTKRSCVVLPPQGSGQAAWPSFPESCFEGNILWRTWRAFYKQREGKQEEREGLHTAEEAGTAALEGRACLHSWASEVCCASAWKE